jgi:hypothetical protein
VTYKKVGLGFVFDRVMGMKDFDQAKEDLYTPFYWARGRLYIRFYGSLLYWMQKEGMQLRQDVSDLVEDYIELMDRESQTGCSKYFKDVSADKIGEFRCRLVELKSSLGSTARNNGSSRMDTGTEPGNISPRALEAARDSR